jgi:3-hydroxyisobutyrate dehydrogenase-like beta-hydroxyacid dehydrogenase
VARGATGAPSPVEAARDAEVVITMLADPAAVDQVVFGHDGVAGSIGPDAVLIDMSTVGPTAIRSVGERLQPVPVLDAPVLGSVPHAEAGSLVILVGGDRAVLSRCTEVLETMGRIQHVGPSGAGAIVKLANNAAVMSTLRSLGEVLALTDRAGPDAGVVLDAIGSGPSPPSWIASATIWPGRWAGRLPVGVGSQDLALALSESRKLDSARSCSKRRSPGAMRQSRRGGRTRTTPRSSGT